MNADESIKASLIYFFILLSSLKFDTLIIDIVCSKSKKPLKKSEVQVAL